MAGNWRKAVFNQSGHDKEKRKAFKHSALLFFMILQFAFINQLLSQVLEPKDPMLKTPDGKRIYTTTQIKSTPPKIDGILDEPCWDEGYWSDQYQQSMPTEGVEPTQKTELKILYDNENIYVAIRAFDNEPDKIDRQRGRRDEFTGDIVGVCFDSYFDHRTGFEFNLTAAGSKIDLILTNDGWDTNWNAVWYGKVGFEDSAWVAEMQIPLSQLRYGNNNDQIWGLHSWRWLNRNLEEDQWQLMPRDGPGPLYTMGELHGIEKIAVNRKVELLPYAVGQLNTTKRISDNPLVKSTSKRFSFGLDGKIGISNNFTMDFTVNPDFGQVEADPSVLNLTVFETFLEEKRPFFLEGANIMDFEFGNDLLFYSRRIGHRPMLNPLLESEEYAEEIDNTSILGAVKLTGKTKKGLSVGLIESLTAREKIRIQSGSEIRKETVEPLTNYLVGRVQQDYNKGNTMIGGMFTATNRLIDQPSLKQLNRSAYTGGIDFIHHWSNKTYYLNAKTVFSHIKGSNESIANLQLSSARYYQRPDADHLSLDTAMNQLSGFGGNIEIGKGSKGRWRYSANINWRSPGLDLNDVGYMQLSDILSQELSVGYIENEPKSIFRTFSVFLNQQNAWNFGSTYLGSRLMAHMRSIFSNKWSFTGSAMRQGAKLDTRLLRGGPALLIKGHWHNRYVVSTDHSRRFSVRMGYHFHLFDDKISSTNDIFPGFTFKINDAIKFSTDLMYMVRRTNLQYVDQWIENDESEYLLATFDRKTMGVTIRIDYAITPDLTIQYYGNPYVSAGRYSDYKIITNTNANQYEDMYHTLSSSELSFNPEQNLYQIDVGEVNHTFSNPDFNFRQMRSNLVARWEYKPGSTLYLVWTHGRDEYQNTSDYSIREGFNQLFNLYADNVVLIKFNYWFVI